MRLKQTGWTLLLAVWLTQGLLALWPMNPLPAGAVRSAQTPSAGPRFTVQQRAASAHFHQLRFGEFQSWLVRGLLPDLASPPSEPVVLPPVRPVATLRIVAQRTVAVAWRFRERTALPPRAPCHG